MRLYTELCFLAQNITSIVCYYCVAEMYQLQRHLFLRNLIIMTIALNLKLYSKASLHSRVHLYNLYTLKAPNKAEILMNGGLSENNRG